MAHILLLQHDPRSAAVLRGALEPHHRVQAIKGWDELERRLKGGHARGCLLDPLDATPPVSHTSLRKLRRAHPGVALMIASDFTGREMELYHLGRLSVDGVLRMEEEPSHRDIRRMVDGALTSALAEMVVQVTAKDVPPIAQEAVRWAIEHAGDRPRVSALAAALGMGPRAFLRETGSLGIASPRDLLLWGRLILASHLLEEPRQTVEKVAFQLEYSTGGALRKALKDRVGCSPTELLRRGGLAWTLEMFRKKGLRRKGE